MRQTTIALFLGLLLTLMANSTAQDLDQTAQEERFKANEALTIDVVLDTAAFLNGGYPIDSAGYVDLPILGKVEVVNRTREEIETYLSGKLSNYLKDTHISAIPAIRITWLGHWIKPKQYYVSPNTTVWEAVLMAGGIAGERNLEKLQVRRGSKLVPLPLLDSYSQGQTLVGAGIQSGDIIIIPVPRVDEGFWYWFRESLTLTAQIATIATAAMTTYVLYLSLDKK